MLAREDQKRVDTIRAELGTIRVGQACVMSSVLDEVRDLLDTEWILLHAGSDDGGGWQIARWHEAGGSSHRWMVERALSRVSTVPLFESLVRPPVAHRNRVVEMMGWADRHMPGWRRSLRMYTEILEPSGLHRHKQPRALLCDGPALVGFFAAYHPGTVTRRQMRVMSGLVRPLRDRLVLEKHLAGVPRTSGALRCALEALGAPAFIVGATGRIHETNSAARALLVDSHVELRRAFADAVAGRPNAFGIELVPISDRGLPSHFLAIVRTESVETRIAACVQLCVARWGLTPRQSAVLALLARGLANATIAVTLGTGERTIELHVTAIFDRAGVDSRAALVARVLTSD
jgi:DNA-binding CsgD family transcriptional regulator